MKRWPLQSRAEYEAIQRGRTAAKWTLNGITREEVEWIHARVPLAIAQGPILCLGVRNGLEVDLFRDVFRCEMQGVELHPQGIRPDVWIGSFDAMPVQWAGKFALLYSNALDHAYDPVETAREWRRVAQPGAMLALSLDMDKEPSATDPIAQITPTDLRAWFGGHLYEPDIIGAMATDFSLVRVLWRLP